MMMYIKVTTYAPRPLATRGSKIYWMLRSPEELFTEAFRPLHLLILHEK